MNTRPTLSLTMTDTAGRKSVIHDGEAYAMLLSLSRAYLRSHERLEMNPTRGLAALVGSKEYNFIPNVYVVATKAFGLKLHLKPGDCGCAFKQLAGRAA